MTSSNEKTRRLFFALWPDDAVQGQLAAVASRWTQHPVPAANIHMTLVFLGACSEAKSRCCCEAVSGIRRESFEWQLDYLGAWPRRGIQWLGSSRIPEVLPGLVKDLESVLLPCGYEPEKRPFVPHITLSRKERNPRPQAGVEPVRWWVRDFVLVESRNTPDGIKYVVLQRWPLEDRA